MMSDCVMKLGPGGWVRSPRMVVEEVEGVALSGWRKRKGKEEMAVSTRTLVTSERRKGGNNTLQGWVDLLPGTTTVNQGTQRPQEYSIYYICKTRLTPALLFCLRYKTSFYTTFNFMACSHAFTIITSVSVSSMIHALRHGVSWEFLCQFIDFFSSCRK